ncbi:hypothetical protein JX265_011834 [Neoarthrinium moseri]|uniref:Alpha and gamma adaptin binding protein p34 n=1 Tax=Neoarthrinium moseri TaxID=1658444 RepID=A0A9P9WBT5_9PEZI|nr:uncharacterized protein JN550_010353 [Neoarthrinium moseri]KAI1847158.1 hypothetical protein JX266_006698 [Neoarthrinium moseri]KAI1856119.1 hypothetical protein JX265_011834 [Neoarthrinium moseri]KAI1862197.1 hypothetical protein JN550_010353 [Neoarthrinium moseri]
MDIANPRRILAVSLEDSQQHLSKLVKDLTGSAPQLVSTTLAGTTHSLDLKTAYYSASVPIWLDLVSSPTEWAASFLAPEAKEVLNVLGGVIVVFSLPIDPHSDEGRTARELIQNVGKVVKEGLGGWSWDGVGLCLGIGEIDDVEEWDECAAESGLEFVQVRAKESETRNEFGEKTGIPRAREALEANDWSYDGGDLDSDFGDFETSLDDDAGPDDALGAQGPVLDPENLDFGFDREDFAGLKRAIWNSGKEDDEIFMDGEASKHPLEEKANEEDARLDDIEIQKLEGMMRKLQAVRDMSAGLPEEQRKRMAAKAVNEVMKDL